MYVFTTVVYLIRYLLFQIQKRRSHFMVAKLSVIPAAIYVVGKEQSEIEFFCMISVLVSYYTVKQLRSLCAVALTGFLMEGYSCENNVETKLTKFSFLKNRIFSPVRKFKHFLPEFKWRPKKSQIKNVLCLPHCSFGRFQILFVGP